MRCLPASSFQKTTSKFCESIVFPYYSHYNTIIGVFLPDNRCDPVNLHNDLLTAEVRRIFVEYSANTAAIRGHSRPNDLGKRSRAYNFYAVSGKKRYNAYR